MGFRVLADMVVLVHLAWIGFLLMGALWGARHRAVAIVHIGALGFAVFLQVMGWYCPLTHLEVWLRERHDPALSYPGSFIAHYAEELIYLEIPPWMILAFTLALSALNVGIYIRAWERRRR